MASLPVGLTLTGDRRNATPPAPSSGLTLDEKYLLDPDDLNLRKYLDHLHPVFKFVSEFVSEKLYPNNDPKTSLQRPYHTDLSKFSLESDNYKMVSAKHLPILKAALSHLDLIRTLLFSNPDQQEWIVDLENVRDDTQNRDQATIKSKRSMAAGSGLYPHLRMLYRLLGLNTPVYKSSAPLDESLYTRLTKSLPSIDKLIGKFEDDISFKAFVCYAYFFLPTKAAKPDGMTALNAALLEAMKFGSHVDDQDRLTQLSLFHHANIDNSPLNFFGIQSTIMNTSFPELGSSQHNLKKTNYLKYMYHLSKERMDAMKKERDERIQAKRQLSENEKDQGVESDPKKPRVEEEEEKEKEEEEEDSMPVVYDELSSPMIGTRMEGDVFNTKVQEDKMEEIRSREKIYHFLSSLYAYISDLVNILLVADTIKQSQADAIAQTKISRLTRLELVCTKIGRVRTYYYAQVYSSLIPYYNWIDADPKAKWVKSSNVIYVNGIKTNVDMAVHTRRDLADLKENPMATPALYDHIWANVSSLDERPSLYMPYIFWSAFQEVHADADSKDVLAVVTATEGPNAGNKVYQLSLEALKAEEFKTAKFIMRGHSMNFRAILDYWCESQYKKLLMLDTIGAVDRTDKEGFEKMNKHYESDKVASMHTKLAWLTGEDNGKYMKTAKHVVESYIRTCNPTFGAALVDTGDKYPFYKFNFKYYVKNTTTPTTIVFSPRPDKTLDANKMPKETWTISQIFNIKEKDKDDIKLAGFFKGSRLTESTGKIETDTRPYDLWLNGKQLRQPLVMFDIASLFYKFTFQNMVLEDVSETLWLPVLHMKPDSKILLKTLFQKDTNTKLVLCRSSPLAIPRTLSAYPIGYNQSTADLKRKETPKIDSPLENLQNLWIINPPLPSNKNRDFLVSRAVTIPITGAGQMANIVVAGIVDPAEDQFEPFRMHPVKFIIPPAINTESFAPQIMIDLVPNIDKYFNMTSFGGKYHNLNPTKDPMYYKKIKDADATKFNADMKDFVQKCFTFTQDVDHIQIIPKLIQVELERYNPTRRPASINKGALDNDFDERLAQYWWEAHLQNTAYNMEFVDVDKKKFGVEAITTIDDLELAMNDNQLLDSLPVLGKLLQNTVLKPGGHVNYLAMFDDLKQSIMEHRKFKEIKIGGSNSKAEVYIDLVKDEHTEKDVQLLNDFKLARLGQGLLNWLTDTTSMLCYDVFSNTTPIRTLGYVPSMITDGFNLIAHTYRKNIKGGNESFELIEYMKASNLKSGSTPSIFFTPRIPVKDIISGQGMAQALGISRKNWMTEFASKMNGPANRDGSRSRAWDMEKEGDVTEFMNMITGFNGFALMFPVMNSTIRYSLSQIRDGRKAFLDENVLLLIKAKYNEIRKKGFKELNDDYDSLMFNFKTSRWETYTLVPEVTTPSTTTGKKTKGDAKAKNAPTDDDIEDENMPVILSMRRIIDRIKAAYTTTQPNFNFSKNEPVMLIFDLFDKNRLAAAKSKFQLSKAPNSETMVLKYTNEFFEEIGMNWIELLKLSPDKETLYVVEIPLETIFKLMIQRCIQMPFSPLQFYNEYDAHVPEVAKAFRQAQPSNKSEAYVVSNAFFPRVANPAYGNHHVVNSVSKQAVVGTVKSVAHEMSATFNKGMKIFDKLRAQAGNTNSEEERNKKLARNLLFSGADAEIETVAGKVLPLLKFVAQHVTELEPEPETRSDPQTLWDLLPRDVVFGKVSLLDFEAIYKDVYKQDDDEEEEEEEKEESGDGSATTAGNETNSKPKKKPRARAKKDTTKKPKGKGKGKGKEKEEDPMQVDNEEPKKEVEEEEFPYGSDEIEKDLEDAMDEDKSDTTVTTTTTTKATKTKKGEFETIYDGFIGKSRELTFKAVVNNHKERWVKSIINYANEHWCIYLTYDALTQDNHFRRFIGNENIDAIWQMRCVDDFVRHPGSIVSLAHEPPKDPDAPLKSLTPSEVITRFYEKIYYTQKQYDMPLEERPINDSVYEGRDVPLLFDAWRFPVFVELPDNMTESMSSEARQELNTVERVSVDEEQTIVNKFLSNAGLSEDQKRDRFYVNNALDNPLQACSAYYLKTRDNMLYMSLCYFSMLYFEQFLSNLGQGSEVVPQVKSFCTEYSHWFTRDFCSHLIAFGVLPDTYAHASFRSNKNITSLEIAQQEIKKNRRKAALAAANKSSSETEAAEEENDENELEEDERFMQISSSTEEEQIFYVPDSVFFVTMRLYAFGWTSVEAAKTLEEKFSKERLASLTKDLRAHELENKKELINFITTINKNYNTSDVPLSTMIWKYYELSLLQDEIALRQEEHKRLEAKFERLKGTRILTDSERTLIKDRISEYDKYTKEKEAMFESRRDEITRANGQGYDYTYTYRLSMADTKFNQAMIANIKNNGLLNPSSKIKLFQSTPSETYMENSNFTGRYAIPILTYNDVEYEDAIEKEIFIEISTPFILPHKDYKPKKIPTELATAYFNLSPYLRQMYVNGRSTKEIAREVGETILDKLDVTQEEPIVVNSRVLATWLQQFGEQMIYKENITVEEVVEESDAMDVDDAPKPTPKPKLPTVIDLNDDDDEPKPNPKPELEPEPEPDQELEDDEDEENKEKPADSMEVDNTDTRVRVQVEATPETVYDKVQEFLNVILGDTKSEEKQVLLELFSPDLSSEDDKGPDQKHLLNTNLIYDVLTNKLETHILFSLLPSLKEVPKTDPDASKANQPDGPLTINRFISRMHKMLESPQPKGEYTFTKDDYPKLFPVAQGTEKKFETLNTHFTKYASTRLSVFINNHKEAANSIFYTSFRVAHDYDAKYKKFFSALTAQEKPNWIKLPLQFDQLYEAHNKLKESYKQFVAVPVPKDRQLALNILHNNILLPLVELFLATLMVMTHVAQLGTNMKLFKTTLKDTAVSGLDGQPFVERMTHLAHYTVALSDLVHHLAVFMQVVPQQPAAEDDFQAYDLPDDD